MLFNEVDLKQVMRRWASGVAVLTCGNGSARQGMTVSSFTSVSVDPPAITVGVANDTRTKHLIDESQYFAINFLPENSKELSDRFAGFSGDQEDRFSKVRVMAGLYDLPLLEDAAAHLVCRVMHQYNFNRSTLYIGEILYCAKRDDLAPLVFFNREYYRIDK